MKQATSLMICLLLLAGCGTGRELIGRSGHNQESISRPIAKKNPASDVYVDAYSKFEKVDEVELAAKRGPNIDPEDIAKSNDLAQMLSKDPQLAEVKQNIQINTSSGAMVLLGAVGSEAQRERVVEYASAIPGVTRLDVRLRIDPTLVASKQ